MTLHQLAERLGDAESLDQVAAPVSAGAAKVVSPRPVKDALSGKWLGHPVHPLLTDLPIGAWTSALLLDLLGGAETEAAADRLIAVGLLTAVPTAAAGLSDWSDTLGAERRIGLVHAAANVVALSLFGASLAARRRDDRALGRTLSLLGAGALAASGYLGGHLSYSRGVNVNRNAWEAPPDEWTPVARLADLVEDRPHLAMAGDTPVMLVHHQGAVSALVDRCGHAGGPLHEGPVEDGCVTCPWHGSTFRLDDGEVVHGPATAPQPGFEVRVDAGRVLVRARG